MGMIEHGVDSLTVSSNLNSALKNRTTAAWSVNEGDLNTTSTLIFCNDCMYHKNNFKIVPTVFKW